MRGYEPWPTVRRSVPIETARELARRADDARVDAERAARQAEIYRREGAELRREVDALRRERRSQAEREAGAAARDALAAARAELSTTRAALAAVEDELESARGELAEARVVLQAQREALDERAPAPPPVEDPRLQSLLADLANVRRQRDAEIERAREEERGKALGALADVADDLERALGLHPDPGSPWVQGTVAVLGRVRRQLEQAGGVRFGRFGDPFDPELHEAVGLAHGVPDTVVGVQRSGLRHADGTLVRPAQVVVGTSSILNPEAQR